MKRHVSSLDGIRTVAVLAVVVYHCGYLPTGYVGVDIFFALSGFLITSIMLRDHREGRFSLQRFYVRRARRLYPALILVLIVTLPFGALIDTSFLRYLESIAVAAVYLSDFVEQHSPTFLGGLAHTWSLAVEEQFYLVWPLVLTFMLKRQRDRLLPALLILGFLLMCGAQIIGQYDFLPFTRGGELLGGCLLALWLERSTVPAPKTVGIIAAAALVALLAGGPGAGAAPHRSEVASVLTSVIGCLLIGSLMTDGGVLGRLLGLRPLAWMGERSYGIYLWHFPIVLALYDNNLDIAPHRRVWKLAVTLVASTAFAAFSARFVEARFRLYSAGTKPDDAPDSAIDPSEPSDDLGPAGWLPYDPADSIDSIIAGLQARDPPGFGLSAESG